VFIAAVILAATSVPAHGQSATLGAIEGVVTDESGAVLPGVSVTLTSPALQVPQLLLVSDTEGRYRFADLRVGVYRVQGELAGFAIFAREAVRIDAGFVARIDIPMKIGGIEETITVSGASPVVDLASTSGGVVVATADVQSLIPTGGNTQDLIRLVPGLTPLTGQSSNIGKMGISSLAVPTSAYGGGQAEMWVDEFRLTFPLTVSNVSDSGQMDVRTFGTAANVNQPGGVINYVFDSGGNQFHGRVVTDYINGNWQRSNIDDALRAQGFTVGETLTRYYDSHASLGGFLVKDKLWFYGTARKKANKRFTGGSQLNPGLDGRYQTGDEPPIEPTADLNSQVVKLSYQLTQKYQMTALYWRDWNKDYISLDNGFFGNANPRTEPYESSTQFGLNNVFWYGAFKGTPSNRVTFEGQGGFFSDQATYVRQPDAPQATPTYNLNTQLYTGAQISEGAALVPNRDGTQRGYQLRGSVTYIPGSLGAQHTFQLGSRLMLPEYRTTLESGCCGDYYRVFDTIAGVRDTPVFIYTVGGLPLKTLIEDKYFSLYLTDHWSAGRRLTLNLGVRYDRYDTWIPEQTQPASTLTPAIAYPQIATGTWNKLVPRLGLAFDVTGNAKTVLKVFYGRFFQEPPFNNVNYQIPYNPNTSRVTQYRWHDLNGNKEFDEGEVNFDPSGGDFVSERGGINSIVNQDLKLPRWEEITTSLEHELLPNMAVRALYSYKLNRDSYGTANVARPYSAYNIPLSRTDPGPDGVLNTSDDGGRVTIYDYDPAYRGRQFETVSVINNPRDQTFHSLELSATKRLSNNWSLGASYTRTRVKPAGPTTNPVNFLTNPNDAFNSTGAYWREAFRLNGGYQLPWGISTGAVFTLNTGALGQRTYIFRAADPLGGPSLTQLATVTLNLEPLNSRRTPDWARLDLRGSKTFQLPGKLELQVNLDVLNATNDNAAQAITFASGPTFGQTTAIPTPMTMQIGGQLRF
jgi:outer membrane receptor protein involved in Fe transport